MTTDKLKSVWPVVPEIAQQEEQQPQFQTGSSVQTAASTIPDLQPKTGVPVDFVASFLRAGDAIINDLRKKLLETESSHRETRSRMLLDHNRQMRDLEMNHEKEVAAIKAEIGVMSDRLGFSN